jgi:ABC transporter substrate binding protein (PQQ-dependent alcohol dehydrogenase system)
LVSPHRAARFTVIMLALAGAAAAQGAPGASPAEPVTLLYVSRQEAQDARGALSEPVEADYGWLGARFGVAELNVNGRFLGKQFQLSRIVVASGEDLRRRVRGALGGRPSLIVADLGAADLLLLADLKEAQDGVVIDARTSDDTLRQSQCRADVFHVLPSWRMRADAMSRFLVGKKWRRWLLLNGPTDEDRGYANALRQAAGATGAVIVRAAPLPNATDGSLTQAQLIARIDAATRVGSAYDVVLVTDASGVTADSIMYNTAEPRLVAGTQGLKATAWDPQFRDFAARGFAYRFDKFASREMSERDFGNWLAVTVLGEAVLRGNASQPASVRRYLLSSGFSVASFKGQPLTFDPRDQQLRQPILLFGPKVLVALMPPDATTTEAAQPGENRCAIQRVSRG